MPTSATGARHRLSEADCELDDFRAVVERTTDPHNHPLAHTVEQNVPVYDSARIRRECATEEAGHRVQAEISWTLAEGPGIAVFKGAFDDHAVVDRTTDTFSALIEQERGVGHGDHFAAPGANDRVWNALEKAALHAPDVFADYYANDILALACAAWLGPGYQVTSQVNVVKPGGAAQTVHRDYHLGFLSNDRAAAFPAHVHRLSPVLTLQGAVAHCDMPVESGPTLYLPHSQKYEPGYLAWRRPEFRAYFEERRIQLPLAKGDAVFFNPALFHAAGHNRSASIRRMANLLQISSAFGRAMETVDRERIANALYPVLLRRKAGGASQEWLDNVVAVCADGYPFPTNLDSDPPVEGLAPPAQTDLLSRALAEEWTDEQLRRELRSAAERRQS